jgi:hypothetical protein
VRAAGFPCGWASRARRAETAALFATRGLVGSFAPEGAQILGERVHGGERHPLPSGGAGRRGGYCRAAWSERGRSERRSSASQRKEDGRPGAGTPFPRRAGRKTTRAVFHISPACPSHRLPYSPPNLPARARHGHCLALAAPLGHNSLSHLRLLVPARSAPRKRLNERPDKKAPPGARETHAPFSCTL